MFRTFENHLEINGFFYFIYNCMEKGKIIATLRKLYLMSPERTQCLKTYRLRRGVYECQECFGEFGRKEIEVHHVIPVSKMDNWDWNIFIDRLYNGETVVLCKKCHKTKK